MTAEGGHQLDLVAGHDRHPRRAVTMTDIAHGAGLSRDPARPSQATALCWMIERSFYHASTTSPAQLRDTSETCTHIWLRTAGLT